MRYGPVSKILAACACLACAMPASAVLVTSRTALGGTDSIDWGQLPTIFGSPVLVDEPVDVVTNNGLHAVVTGSGSGFERDDAGLGFAGDFASGDPLLVTLGTPRIRIEFPGGGLSALGAQIQDASFDFSFLASISAFDSLGNLLETQSLRALSGSHHDGSAIFLGIARDTADIASVLFGTSTGQPFAINRTDLSFGGIVEPPPTTSVPEPGILALLAMGVPLVFLVSRRRRPARLHVQPALRRVFHTLGFQLAECPYRRC